MGPSASAQLFVTLGHNSSDEQGNEMKCGRLCFSLEPKPRKPHMALGVCGCYKEAQWLGMHKQAGTRTGKHQGLRYYFTWPSTAALANTRCKSAELCVESRYCMHVLPATAQHVRLNTCVLQRDVRVRHAKAIRSSTTVLQAKARTM